MTKSTQSTKSASFLAALFLFQYSLITPLTQIMSPSRLVAISGILIVLAMVIFTKKIVINQPALLTIMIICILMVAKHFIDGTSLSIPIHFLMISLPPIIVFSYKIDYSVFLETCYILSDINFFVLVFVPFSGDFSYMRFGYGMLLTTIFSALYLSQNSTKHLIQKRNMILLFQRTYRFLIFCVSFVEMTLYGARGALVCFVLLIVVYLLLILKASKKVLFWAITSLVAVINLDAIIGLFEKLTRALHMNSYALNKLKLMLTKGLEEASSGRVELYKQALENIKNNPLLGTTMRETGSDDFYVHNLFLQVGVDFGVVAMLISVAFVIYVLLILRKKTIDVKHQVVIAVMFCISCGRLMISSTLWERPEFWGLLCMTFNSQIRNAENAHGR